MNIISLGGGVVVLIGSCEGSFSKEYVAGYCRYFQFVFLDISLVSHCLLEWYFERCLLLPAVNFFSSTLFVDKTFHRLL